VTGIWSLSKTQANYGPAPSPEVRCDHCRYMFPRLGIGGCRLIRGVIHAGDSCKEFTAREPARDRPET
jgi:hypothetical protein